MAIPVPAATAHALIAAREGQPIKEKVSLLWRAHAAQRVQSHLDAVESRPDLITQMSEEQRARFNEARAVVAPILSSAAQPPKTRRLR